MKGMIKINYNPFKLTALQRKDLSVPMRKLLQLGILDEKSCLDYGCGWGNDVEILRCKHYISIDGYDKHNDMFSNNDLLKRKYDLITCNYVFNVINDLDEHSEVLSLLKNIGKEIYISVRSDSKAIKDTWEYIDESDCWKTPKNSYQRFYTEDMIEKYFGKVTYIVNNSSLKLFKLQ